MSDIVVQFVESNPVNIDFAETNPITIQFEISTVSSVNSKSGTVVLTDNDILEKNITTAISESIDTSLYSVINQSVSGINTTLTNAILNRRITIFNDSDGANYIYATINGEVNPEIYSKESFDLWHNGTEWRLV